MKTADIKNHLGEARTTVETKYGFGGSTVILLGVGWTKRPSWSMTGTKYIPGGKGVAVAIQSGYNQRWHPDVLQPSQIADVTPEELAARQERAREIQRRDAEQRQALREAAETSVQRANREGFSARWTGGDEVRMTAEELERLLDCAEIVKNLRSGLCSA